MATDAASKHSILTASGWPVPWREVVRDWLGEIDIHLPADSLRGEFRLLGILASHRSREESLNPWWETALESALIHAKHSDRILFFSGASPYADRLRHASQRFGLPFLVLCHRTDDASNSVPGTILLRHRGNPLPNRAALPESKIEDRAIAILSHQVFGLHVRPEGKISRLLEERLAEPLMTPGSTIVAMQERGLSRKTSGSLLRLSQQGAVLWMLPKTAPISSHSWSDDGLTRTCHTSTSPSTRMPFGPASNRLLDSGEYLIHFTRGRQGAWPDQSQENLFDEAIRMRWSSQQRPLDTLRRILATQRLLASSYLRRGSIRTVCFTAQSFRTMLDRRNFQSHLGRWDWEPYGIAIRKEWLTAHGARPVRYLDPRIIATLSPAEQAFTQPQHPYDAINKHRDWSEEQEWRVENDIRLCHIPADAAFLFVHHRNEAASLAYGSRWPIVYLSRETCTQ